MVYTTAFVAISPTILHPREDFHRLHPNISHYHHRNLSSSSFIPRQPQITICKTIRVHLTSPMRKNVHSPELEILSRMRIHLRKGYRKSRFMRKNKKQIQKLESWLNQQKWSSFLRADGGLQSKQGAMLLTLALIGIVPPLLYHAYMFIACILAPVFMVMALPFMLIPFFFMFALMAFFFLMCFFTSIMIGFPLLALGTAFSGLFTGGIVILAIVGIALGLIASNIAGESDDDDDECEEEDENDEDWSQWKNWASQFEFFDQLLRKRTGGFKASPSVYVWGYDEVGAELEAWGLGEYKDLFRNEKIDGRTLLDMTEDDIRGEFVGVMPLADRKQLLRMIAELKKRATRFA